MVTSTHKVGGSGRPIKENKKRRRPHQEKLNVPRTEESSRKATPGALRQSKQKRPKVEEVCSAQGLDVRSEEALTSSLWNLYKKSCSLTDLELSDLSGRGVYKLPTQGLLQERLAVLEHLWHNPKTFPPQVHKPVALFISPAAITCAAAVREMPRYQKECRIAKLFAKHFKVEEQKAYLAAHPLVMGVGTPNRIHRLTDLGALSLDRLQVLVLDLRPDVKQRTLLDIKETRDDWWQFFRQHLHVLLAGSKTRLALLIDEKQ
eukprot:jgi/Botrbrau1/15975/Bobra.0375s0002.1